MAPADLAVKQPFKSACLLTALSCLRGGSSFYQASWSHSLQIKAPPALLPLQASLSFSLSKSLKEKPPLNSPQEFLKGTTSQCKHSGKTDTRPGPKSTAHPLCKCVPAQGKYSVKPAGPMYAALSPVSLVWCPEGIRSSSVPRTLRSCHRNGRCEYVRLPRVNPEQHCAADPQGPPADTRVSHSQDPGLFAAHPPRASGTLKLQDGSRMRWQMNSLQLRLGQWFGLIYCPDTLACPRCLGNERNPKA